MKPALTKSVFCYGSGLAGTSVILSPCDGYITGIDFAICGMIGELAAATTFSSVVVGLGAVVTPTTMDERAENIIASVYLQGRSNASAALVNNLGKFVGPIAVRITPRDRITIDVNIGANHTLRGWVTIHVTPL